MSWNDLTFVECSLLTSSQMTMLQANFPALAAGMSGSPPITVNSIAWSGQGSGAALHVSSGLTAPRVSSLGTLHVASGWVAPQVGSLGTVHASSGLLAPQVSSLGTLHIGSGFLAPETSSVGGLEVSSSIRITGAAPSPPVAATLYKESVPGGWVNFKGIPQTGTYALVSNVVTVTITGHGLSVGMGVDLDFTTGTATDGFYEVLTVADANTFTVAVVSGDTSGNVTLNLFVRDSFNVSSIDDIGTGLYTVNWDLAFASAEYVAVVSGYGLATANRYAGTYGYTAGSVNVSNWRDDGVAADPSLITLVAYGAQ